MFENKIDKSNIVTPPLIYLVDDEDDFREEMVLGLSRLGLNVHGFHNAKALYRAYAAKPSQIVILDIALEGEDGLSIAAHLRTLQSIGIIMVTGKGTIEDRVVSLQKGADVCLVKPIDVRELAATVVALNKSINRHRKAAPSLVAPQWALVEGGGTLTDGLGHRLRLTVSEQRLLGCLFRDRGKTIGRSALVEAMGEDVHDFDYAQLDTIISRLRRRAQKANMLPPLHAIRGLGFIFPD